MEEFEIDDDSDSDPLLHPEHHHERPTRGHATGGSPSPALHNTPTALPALPSLQPPLLPAPVHVQHPADPLPSLYWADVHLSLAPHSSRPEQGVPYPWADSKLKPAAEPLPRPKPDPPPPRTTTNSPPGGAHSSSTASNSTHPRPTSPTSS
ncbi:hypothetical protein NMY22_g14228 [Coprinellus aureogranulatus]|nr:hypothetical protein NMY22_g14228 [Coprinellus aureogranulatus]